LCFVLLVLFVLSQLVVHRDLHSFPTRRSSDLLEYLFDDRGLLGVQLNRDEPAPVVIDPDIPVSRAAHRTPSHHRGFPAAHHPSRSEEHTSELQSRENLVCRLLLEKKKPEAKLT